MWMLLTALGTAAPPEGFVEVKAAKDCVIYKGPADADGVSPMVAECHWQDVDPGELNEKLADFTAYDDLIFGVQTSDVKRTDGARSLVHQVQATRGIATREVLIWMESTGEGDSRTHRWVTAASEPLSVGEGNVRAPRNDGSWTVRPHPDGGSAVTHRIAYDPGGSVPGWVVRWFQVGGMLQVMDEVRASAASVSSPTP